MINFIIKRRTSRVCRESILNNFLKVHVASVEKLHTYGNKTKFIQQTPRIKLDIIQLTILFFAYVLYYCHDTQ